MIKVFTYTLGCRLNQCESEGIMDAFLSNGFEKATDGKDAEFVIVNTCTVTSKAEQKARRMIRLFSETARVVLVTGCYAEMSRDEILKLSDKIVIFDMAQKASILELPGWIREGLRNGETLEHLVRNFRKVDADPFKFDAAHFAYHSRAYLKVQDGCDNHCGYCRTSIARGASISLDKEEVVKRALKLESEGFHEIMLTGVNLTMYNHDNGGLGELCEMLLEALGPDMRIRFSSMEADHIDDRLLECIRDKRIQPHFHLPIQSASDKVLAISERKYQISKIAYVIDKIREYRDDPFFACDIITGLPGEMEEDFQMTYDFLEKYDLAAVHVFPYSPRLGTALYKTKEHHVEERIRDERAAILRNLSEKHLRRYISRQEGKEVEILVEQNVKGVFHGTTGNYLKAEIVWKGEGELKSGDLLKGRFTKLSPLTVECSWKAD